MLFFCLRDGRALFEIIQFSSVAQSCLTLCDPVDRAHQASRSITSSQSLPKLMSMESVMPSSHLILCRPLLLLPSIFPSIRVFSSESALHIRWPKYWSFCFNISSSNEHPGLISFRMDWLDLLAVQGTLKSLLQHHSSKASILQCSAFFIERISRHYFFFFQSNKCCFPTPKEKFRKMNDGRKERSIVARDRNEVGLCLHWLSVM